MVELETVLRKLTESPQFWGLTFFLQKFKWSMHSDEIAFPTTGLHPNTVCWKHQVLRDVDRKINLLPWPRGHPYPTKEEKGDWETFVKRCEKYGPKLNPGSAIFVDGNLFGVVEMVGKFERELYGTTVGSIFGSASLAPRPGHATSPKPFDYGWTVLGLPSCSLEQSWIWIGLYSMPKTNNIYWSLWELRKLIFARRAEMFFVILFGSFWLLCL